MKLLEILKIIHDNPYTVKITRDNWPYHIQFDPMSGYLEIWNGDGALSTYTLSLFDFDYEWRIL
ncbi:hypothetical protein AQUSIP_12670 [Aquicella siphonis]|uniref:Uncharacterized protein n=1 Tax=Aquicella siphonis TaxID=254247 RepID=A0A5E4PI12_9COXI|nr:hypothetical protein AQUSIP_12670 [Aquicella siphonis]